MTALSAPETFQEAMSALGVGVLAIPAFTEDCCLPDLLDKQQVIDGPTLNADIAFQEPSVTSLIQSEYP